MLPKKRARPVESGSDTNKEEFSNTCRGCQKTLSSLAYLKKHLDRSKTHCNQKYSDREIDSITLRILELNQEKKKKQNHDYAAKNKEDISQKKAQYYQNSKEEISQKKAQNYQKQKAKQAQWYQENKGKRAQWYQENKEKIAQKYQENKEKIAQRYQEKKEEIENKLTSEVRILNF